MKLSLILYEVQHNPCYLETYFIYKKKENNTVNCLLRGFHGLKERLEFHRLRCHRQLLPPEMCGVKTDLFILNNGFFVVVNES